MYNTFNILIIKIEKNVKISNLFIRSIVCATILSGCSSGGDSAVKSIMPGGYSINGNAIYLRGEMNDYEVSETYRLRQNGEGYCALATLRADWAPYKFKFADKDWSEGTNFGFLNPPGVLREGARAIELTPNSNFEEISYYPKADGVYRFCLIPRGDRYYVTVNKSSKKELPSMAQVIKLASND